MHEPSAVPSAVWADVSVAPPWTLLLWRRVLTFCWLELIKIRHDQTELLTRTIQPILWLLVFGETFSRLHAIPTGGIPYLDFMAPGVIAQSALFVSIFFGIQLIWEKDFGILTRLLATPTPHSALVAGKLGAGVRGLAQALIVLVLCAILGVGLSWNPIHLLGAVIAILLGSAFFATLSMTIAGLVMNRERLMGIGQAITMPLFFASNALYPIKVMPWPLQVLSNINPLSYEVDALRAVLLGTPGHLGLDYAVLAVAAFLGVAASSRLMSRLAS